MLCHAYLTDDEIKSNHQATNERAMIPVTVIVTDVSGEEEWFALKSHKSHGSSTTLTQVPSSSATE